MQHLEGSGTPVLYIGRTVLNPLNAELFCGGISILRVLFEIPKYFEN